MRGRPINRTIRGHLFLGLVCTRLQETCDCRQRGGGTRRHAPVRHAPGNEKKFPASVCTVTLPTSPADSGRLAATSWMMVRLVGPVLSEYRAAANLESPHVRL